MRKVILLTFLPILLTACQLKTPVETAKTFFNDYFKVLQQKTPASTFCSRYPDIIESDETKCIGYFNDASNYIEQYRINFNFKFDSFICDEDASTETPVELRIYDFRFTAQIWADKNPDTINDVDEHFQITLTRDKNWSVKTTNLDFSSFLYHFEIPAYLR